MAPRSVVDSDRHGSRACSGGAVPPAWEPEPLGLPVEVPRPPARDQEVEDEPDDSDRPAGAIVIDLC